MRNLKKILALVLALVMSLSLMATAGAKDFGDSDQVNANYKTAIDVLSELKVFGGYDDGTFKPQQNITRAEVAAIIYRIATGDVMGDKVALYSDMTNSKLADLNQAEWARGQINYCYNAGIIKGVNNTDFEPNANVTGYAALTMILRALGYGQNGEFVGDQWEMNTASRARELGLLDKISEGQLGAPATREMVAEILFRTMLKETVTWTALQGYQTTGTTLGYKTFQLRDVTGVVTANKWANLYGDKVLADEQTNVILTGEEKATRIAIDTELTDIGEARHFYLTGAVGAKEANFIAYDQEGVTNNTYSNAGAAKDVSTNSKFSNVTGITKDANTEQFINFGYATEGKSDYRLEYQVVFDNSADYTYDGKTSQEWFADKYGVDPDDVIAVNGDTRLDTEKVDGSTVTYTRVIPRGDGISAADIAIMDGIFSVADNNESKSAGIDGYVYAGTNSTSSVDRSRDLSDELNWNEFYDTYIASRANTVVDGVENGEWLKAVDNNNDGVAEYVFKTTFAMDEALSSSTLKGEEYLDYYKLDVHSDDYDIRYIDEVNVGDVVVYTIIDGVANVTVAEPVPATVKDVNFKTVEIVTTDDEPYGQSGIANDTEMDDNILNMADKTEYSLFLDKFGYVRAYKLPGGTQYGLVTEAYYGFGQNGAFVQKNSITVELGLGEEEIGELQLSNPKNNELVVADGFYNHVAGRNNIRYDNYLQPAVAHLGTDSAFLNMATKFETNPFAHIWGDGRYVWEINTPATTTGGNWPTFDYGVLTKAQVGKDISHYVSMTNIAVVSSLTEDSVALDGAAQYAYDKSTGERLYRVVGESADATNAAKTDATVAGAFKLNEKVTQAQWEEAYSKWDKKTGTASAMFDACLAAETLVPAFKVDYIQLDRTLDIAAGARHYYIDDHTNGTAGTNYKALNNNYIDAINDTQYYIVDGSGHTFFTGYKDMPAVDADNILAIYAVATDTVADKDEIPYWVADVIVIEVDEWTSKDFHSISLAYYEPRKSSERVHYVETLNNESEDPMLTIVEKNSWGNNWKNYEYGFYKLYDAEMDGDELMVGEVEGITKGSYNANGIYAGTYLRTRTIKNKGQYVDVQLNYRASGDAEKGEYVGQPDVAISVAPIYTITSNSAKEISWSSVDVGDNLIFVVDNAKKVTKFVIHLGSSDVSYLTARPDTPSWLWAEYADISEEQGWTGGDASNIQCLIDAATALTKANAKPSFYQLNASKTALTEAVAAGSGVKMTEDQKKAINTADTGLLALLDKKVETVGNTELAAVIKTAQDLVDARIKGFEDYKAVKDAASALKTAIGKVTAIDKDKNGVQTGTLTVDGDIVYDGALLDPTHAGVKAIDEALRLAEKIKPAIAAVDAKVGDKKVEDYAGAEDAYNTLIDAIQSVDCVSIPESNPDELKAPLDAYYKDGKLVEDQELVQALLDALKGDPMSPEAKDQIALEEARAEAENVVETYKESELDAMSADNTGAAGLVTAAVGALGEAVEADDATAKSVNDAIAVYKDAVTKAIALDKKATEQLEVVEGYIETLSDEDQQTLETAKFDENGDIAKAATDAIKKAKLEKTITDAVNEYKQAVADALTKAAVDAAIDAAKTELDKVEVAELAANVSAANAETAATAAIAKITDILTKKLPKSDVEVTVTVAFGENALDGMKAGTAVDTAALTITLSAEGTDTEKTVDDKTSAVTWYYDRTALKAAIKAELDKITTADDYENLAALKTAIDGAIKKIASDDYALTIAESTTTAAGKKDFTYTVTYAKGVTGCEVKLENEPGSVTLA